MSNSFNVTIKDFAVTPLLLILILTIAFVIRKSISLGDTYRFFIPALTIKIFGAIAVGTIYQFYYGGGDTFNFWQHGSSHLYEAFMKDFGLGLRLLFANGDFIPEGYEFSSKIWFYRDPASYQIIRIAAIFDLFTFNTYSGTATLFAVFSFSGIWALYQTYVRFYPNYYKSLALAILFFPSLWFWGSGILKDTISLGAIGWVVFATTQLFIFRKHLILSAIMMTVSIYLIGTIKVYIILTLIPTLLIWMYLVHIDRFKSPLLRFTIAPVLIAIIVGLGFFAARQVGEINQRYALENIPTWVQVTAYDIRYMTGKDAGSGYSLGEIEPTYAGLFRLAPKAIFVSLFQPFLWQVHNPLIGIAALESFIVTILTLSVVIIVGIRRIWQLIKSSPLLIFSLLFALIFAFAVGVSSYNFGTLMRYKIPLLPFYLSSLAIIYGKYLDFKKIEDARKRN